MQLLRSRCRSLLFSTSPVAELGPVGGVPPGLRERFLLWTLRLPDCRWHLLLTWTATAPGASHGLVLEEPSWNAQGRSASSCGLLQHLFLQGGVRVPLSSPPPVLPPLQGLADHRAPDAWLPSLRKHFRKQAKEGSCVESRSAVASPLFPLCRSAQALGAHAVCSGCSLVVVPAFS